MSAGGNREKETRLRGWGFRGEPGENYLTSFDRKDEKKGELKRGGAGV